jgi:hypothetical protein
MTISSTSLHSDVRVPSTFIGLSGPARVGKSYMLNWLTTNYEVSNCNPGEALKVMWSFSRDADLQALLGRFYLKELKRSELLEILQVNANFLLASYEHEKRYEISEGRGQEFRQRLIGFAEMWRAFYPEIWVKLAKELFYQEGKPAVGEILNQGEYQILRSQYDYVVPVKLECAYPASGGGDDSRGALSHYEMIHKYDNPTQSIEVAQLMIFEYHEFGIFHSPNILLPSIQKRPF